MRDILKINKCLISVSDKANIEKFAREIVAKKIEIISTGNTFKILKDKKVRVKKVESITKFPEILGGRVKTLHPKIFGGILGDLQTNTCKRNDKASIKVSIDVVNLYPLEK